MKTMTCKDLGGPCEFAHHGATADEVIKHVIGRVRSTGQRLLLREVDERFVRPQPGKLNQTVAQTAYAGHAAKAFQPGLLKLTGRGAQGLPREGGMALVPGQPSQPAQEQRDAGQPVKELRSQRTHRPGGAARRVRP